jgi:LysM repeat protein
MWQGAMRQEQRVMVPIAGGAIRPRRPGHAGIAACVVVWLLAACSLPEPGSAAPRVTSTIELAISPAPTRDVDATVTAYALAVIASPTPTGLYIVQPGDTLSGIALEFGTTVQELIALNGLTDPNAIQVGQTLIVPSIANVSPIVSTLTPTPGGPSPTADGTPVVDGTPAPDAVTPTLATP